MERSSPPAVSVESTVEPLQFSNCSETLPEPLFLLERLPHIRTFCLSVRGADGARLEHAEAVVEGSSVTIRCHLTSDLDASLCCLRLDVGEERRLQVGCMCSALCREWIEICIRTE